LNLQFILDYSPSTLVQLKKNANSSFESQVAAYEDLMLNLIVQTPNISWILSIVLLFILSFFSFSYFFFFFFFFFLPFYFFSAHTASINHPA